MRRIRNNDTGDCYYVDSMDSSNQTAAGIFDTITNLIGKAAIKTASTAGKVAANETTKKLGKLAAEKVGQKAAEAVMNKIAPGPIKRIENNLENKGSQIIQKLKKLQPKEKQTTEYKSDSYFSDQFDKLINM